MNHTGKYRPFKSFVACAAALLTYFAVDFNADLTRYNPLKHNPAAYRAETQYPLTGYQEIGDFVVEKREASSKEDELLFVPLGNSKDLEKRMVE